MCPTSDKLRSILGTPGWERFIATLRSCRDAGRPLPATVTLSNPTEDERRRHGALLRLNQHSRAKGLRYDLNAIGQVLALAGATDNWGDILNTLCGPIPETALAKQASAHEWREFWPSAIASLSANPFPLSMEWLDTLRRDGTLKRLTSGNATVASHELGVAVRLLQALPLAEEQPLTQTAAQYCGNSHALDPDRPLSTLILRGLALRLGQPLPSRAPDRRELWARFGVICDDLSAPLLTFNLGVTGDTLLAGLVTQASLAGQPLHFTARLLWNTPWKSVACPPEVFVCENPTIVALAATRLGPKCPPLVCVDGELKTAGRILLRSLQNSGAKLLYHGDFDWPGIAIGARIIREFSAIPWLFDEDAYAENCHHEGRALTGTSVPTPWSLPLSRAMEQAGRAYDEELIADTLLADLKARMG